MRKLWRRFISNEVGAISLGTQAQIAGALGGAAARELTGDLTIQAIDGAAVLTPGAIYYITKGSAIALSVAAPGAGMIGKMMTFLTGSDFAHVVTFTGATLWDGTAGGNSTWTATAVQGCALTVIGVTATKWAVVGFNLGTIAP